MQTPEHHDFVFKINTEKTHFTKQVKYDMELYAHDELEFFPPFFNFLKVRRNIRM